MLCVYSPDCTDFSGNGLGTISPSSALVKETLNGEYELYIWSWSPGVWSQDYEIRDGVMLVDTTGMDGFLIGAFEKGYRIEDPNNWDPNVIKQSPDIKGELLKQGFFDLSGF